MRDKLALKLAQNRIFKHVKLYEAWKTDFEVEISTIEKSSEIRSGGAGWSKNIPWGPRSGLEPLWTI